MGFLCLNINSICLLSDFVGTTFATYTEPSKGNENNLQTFWPNSTPGLTRLGFSVFHKFDASHRKPASFIRVSFILTHTHTHTPKWQIFWSVALWTCEDATKKISAIPIEQTVHGFAPTFHFNQNHLCAFSPQVFLIPFRQCEKKFHFKSISCPILDTRCIVISTRPSNSIVFSPAISFFSPTPCGSQFGPNEL